MIRRFAVAMAGVMLLAVPSSGCGVSRPALAGAGSVWAGEPGVWVVNRNSGTVTPVSLSTHRASRAVTVGAAPASIAITPDGKTVYVSAGAHSVIPISTASGQAGRPIPAGSYPAQMAVTPDGRTVYVAASNYLIPIDTVTSTARMPIKVAPKATQGPEALAVTPDGKTVYADDVEGAIVPVDTATGRVGQPIRAGALDDVMVITPDGKTVYILDGINTVLPISTATNQAGKPIIVGPEESGPMALVVTPDSTTVYVADYGSGTVVPIDTATNRAGQPIKVGWHPTFLAVTPDGKTVYAVTANAVVPIDTATNQAARPIKVAKFHPVAVVISPDGATAWVSGDEEQGRRVGPGPGVINIDHGFVLPIRTATNTPGKPVRTGMGATCLIAAPWRSPHAQGPAACNL